MPAPDPSNLYIEPVIRVSEGVYNYRGYVILVNRHDRVSSLGRKYISYSFETQYKTSLREAYNIIEKVARYYSRRSPLHVNQVIAGGNDHYFSKLNIDQLEEEVYRKMDTYEPGAFIIEGVAVTYSKHEIFDLGINNIEQVAYSSDKDVKVVGDYFVCTLINVKYNCVALAYVTWLLYIGYKSCIWDPIRLKYMLRKYSNIKTLNDISNKYKVLYSYDHINKYIKPEDTINNICLYYSKEHVSIILHNKFISRETSCYLRWMAKPSFLSIIRTKQLKTETTKEINTLDIECVREYNEKDNIIKHIPYCVSHVYNRDIGYKLGLDCIEQIFNDLNNRGENKIIWMHNGGRYDIHLILDKLQDFLDYSYTEPVKIITSGSKVISFLIKMTKCTIEIKDSCCILPASLKRLCKAFNVPNPKDIKIDSTKFRYEDFHTNPNIIRYNILDSIALQQVLRAYSETCLNDINKILPNPLNFCTITSMTKNIFRSKFYNMDKYICHLNKAASNYIRRSYKGGIVRCFKPGIYNNNIYSYDIKSSYPYAATLPLPIYGCKFGYNRGYIKSISDIPIGLSFIRCKVFPPEHKPYSIPVHLYTDDKNMDVEEDIGKNYDQILFSEEIKHGIKQGYKYYMLDILTFADKATILKGFMETIYKYKAEAEDKKDNVNRLIYKMLLNACYGYFGYNKYDKPIIRIYTNNEINRNRCSMLEECGEGIYVEIDKIIYCIQHTDVKVEGINVAIAAAITSYARIRLFDIGKYIQDQGYDIYYCDTDSIKTNMPTLPQNPMFGNQFGQLDIENKEDNIVECCIYKKKLLTTIYSNKLTGKLKAEITSKGINTKKTYVDNINIIKLTQEDIFNIILQFKSAYLNKQDIEIVQGNIVKARSNRIEGKLGLYEKTMLKKISLC